MESSLSKINSMEAVYQAVNEDAGSQWKATSARLGRLSEMSVCHIYIPVR